MRLALDNHSSYVLLTRTEKEVVKLYTSSVHLSYGVDEIIRNPKILRSVVRNRNQIKVEFANRPGGIGIHKTLYDDSSAYSISGFISFLERQYKITQRKSI